MCWDLEGKRDRGMPEMTMLTGSYPTATTAEAAPDLAQADQAQLEADKRAVYKHPLFPLLALLFERCEQATQSAESPNSESFNNDIQAFVLHQERDRKPFLLNDPEIDGLMIKAIQVLRIHLLELEKVQELCKDFCNRYITCLKGKMQSENLLRSDYNSYENNNNHSSDSNSPTNYATSPHNMQMSSLSTTRNSSPSSSPGPGYDFLPQPQLCGLPTQFSSVANASNVGPPPPMQSTAESPGPIHGSTPLSAIGANACPPPVETPLLSGQLSPAPTTPGSMDEDDDFLGGSGKGKKQKRGVLPKHATSVMRSWLFQHLVHPYPTEDEKRQIASQTNLTLLQVNNWFINARRRILQPMLDASNPSEGSSSSNGSKSKKPKSPSASGKQAAQRFWPENLAQLQPQLSESTFGGSSDEEGSEEESEDEGGLVINDEALKEVKDEEEEHTSESDDPARSPAHRSLCMNYGPRSKTPTHSMGTPSIYSHMTRSTTNLKSTRSVKSLKMKWYQKPIVQDAVIMDIQRAAMYTAIYSILLSIFTFVTAVFDLYCYSMAVRGATHYGYYIISYQFVYVGSDAVRNTLIVFSLFSLLGSFVILGTSIVLVMGLRKELESRMSPWLYAFGVFTVFRIFAMVFFAITNDRIFAYNAMMVFLWTIFSAISVYGWILVYSLYIELRDLTKLEDLAHLRIGTMASLNASTTHSIAGSRPTTPHSTVSTAPA